MKTMQIEVEIQLNGQTVSGAAEPRTHLADFIREEALATGTHLGCEQGVCGACTIFIDGEPMRSCLTLAAACDNADIRTVEGFADDPLMQAIRESFKQHHGLQCGYCTPGMLVTAYDIIRRLPGADRQIIRREISGNLCRCTGYEGIVNAIEAVLKDPPVASLQEMARSKPRSRSDGLDKIVSSDSSMSPEAGPTTESEATDLPDADSFDTAVNLEKTITVAAAPDAVWQIISNPEAMVSVIPGASLTAPFDNGIAKGLCEVKVGPMKAQFQGTASIVYQTDAKSGTLVGRGRDDFSRSTLEGRLDFVLVPDGVDSILDLNMRYRLNGPLSQFGRAALIEEIANALLRDIARGLEEKLNGTAISEHHSKAPHPANGSRFLVSALVGLLKRVLRRSR